MVTPVGAWSVKPGHKLAVGGPCRLELVIAFGELPALFCGVLFQLGDAAVETVDILGPRGRTPATPVHRDARTGADGVGRFRDGDAVMGVGQAGNEGWTADVWSFMAAMTTST